MRKSILDEYIKRRQGGSAVYNPQQIQYGQRGGYSTPAPQRTQMPTNQNGQVPVYRANQWSRPAMVKAPLTADTMLSGLDATPPTDGTGSNVLTWDDQIDIEIQNAAKKVLEVSNRKFQYNAYESPIYSIMRQEYLKEADLAAGRATAAAAQNAGGFGSSFAVMAGEEARRQVMEGFHDQEDELYAAARSEYEAERASAFDNYLKLRELKAMEQERLATEVPTTITLEDGATVEVTDAARELYAGYLDSFTQGTGYDTLKTAMINGGASEADADQAIAMFKKLGSATISDQISALETNPTLSGAAEIMAQAKASGIEAEVLPQISEQMITAFGGALEDPSEAYTLLGISAADWHSMFSGYTDPDERASAEKAYVLEAAGEARKQGLMSGEAYVDMLNIDVVSSIKDIMKNEADKPASAVADVVISLQNYKDAGYLSESEYNSALDVINSRVNTNELWKTQTQSWGVKETKKAAEYVLKHLSYTGYKLSASEKRSLMKAIEESASTLDVVMNVINTVPGFGSNIVGQIFGAIEATGKVTGANKPLSMTGDQFEAITELENRKKK